MRCAVCPVAFLLRLQTAVSNDAAGVSCFSLGYDNFAKGRHNHGDNFTSSALRKMIRSLTCLAPQCNKSSPKSRVWIPCRIKFARPYSSACTKRSDLTEPVVCWSFRSLLSADFYNRKSFCCMRYGLFLQEPLCALPWYKVIRSSEHRKERGGHISHNFVQKGETSPAHPGACKRL